MKTQWDKVSHFIGGLLITIGLTLFADISPFYAYAISATVWIFKEIVDDIFGGEANGYDILAGFYGSVIGLLILYGLIGLSANM